MAWPIDWDRGSVLGAIEEASGVALSADDPLPDTLIAKAQELELQPVDLKLWIYDSPEHPWTAENLACWARRNGFLCGHCGRRVTAPEDHTCGDAA